MMIFLIIVVSVLCIVLLICKRLERHKYFVFIVPSWDHSPLKQEIARLTVVKEVRFERSLMYGFRANIGGDFLSFPSSELPQSISTIAVNFSDGSVGIKAKDSVDGEDFIGSKIEGKINSIFSKVVDDVIDIKFSAQIRIL